MKTRVVTACIGFLVALLAISLGGYVYDAIIYILTALGWGEMVKMLRKRHIRMPVWMGHLILFLMLLSLSLGLYTWAGLFLGMGFLILFIRYTFLDSRFNFGDLASTIFALVYVGLGMGALLLIRQDDLLSSFHMPWHMDNWGVISLWLLLFTTWASDTFAYFTGRFLGKRKIVPTISPNKTLEGFIGGFISSILMGLLFAWLVGIPWHFGLMQGLISALLAPLGDLFESKLKRNCQVKDSGVLLPGHGGVLDRFDSLLFVAPISILCLALL